MARRFNGTTQALNTSATLDLTAYTTLTLGFWLYWDAFANNDALCMESSANFNNNVGGILVDPNEGSGTAGFAVGILAASALKNSYYFARPTAAAWHQYTVTLNRGAGAQQVVAAYVDGAPQALTVVPGNNNATSGNFGNYTWYAMSRATTSLFGAGRLCEVALWPGVMLTPAEAFRLGNGARPSEVRPGALKYYWPIAGDLVPDPAARSPSARLVPVAAPSVIAHAPVLPAAWPRRPQGKAPAAAFVAPEPYVVGQSVKRAAYY